MRNWDEWHSDPGISYYMSLRQGYRMSAREALARKNQLAAFIIVSVHAPPESFVKRLLRSFSVLLGVQPTVAADKRLS